jgi:hypothetical protein
MTTIFLVLYVVHTSYWRLSWRLAILVAPLDSIMIVLISTHRNAYYSERSEIFTWTQTKSMASLIFSVFLVNCCSCSPYRVVLHRRLSDYQTWIPIFRRTQSGYKPADLPDFTYLAQNFASASQLSLAASLFSWKTYVKHGFLLSENFMPPTYTLYQFWRAALPPLHKCATYKKMVSRCWLENYLTYNINWFPALTLLQVPFSKHFCCTYVSQDLFTSALWHYRKGVPRKHIWSPLRLRRAEWGSPCT